MMDGGSALFAALALLAGPNAVFAPEVSLDETLPGSSATPNRLLMPQRDCAECPPITRIPSPPDKSFAYVTTYEITFRDFRQAVIENSCQQPHPRQRMGYLQKNLVEETTLDDPRYDSDIALSGVSLSAIQCYINWINEKTGKNYRLPTGKQWLWLAYGKATSAFPWGDLPDEASAKLCPSGCEPSFSGPKPGYVKAPGPVGRLKPNRFGLYDVIGNADELVSDTLGEELGCVDAYAKLGFKVDQSYCERRLMFGGSVFGGYGINGRNVVGFRQPVETKIAGNASRVGFRLIR